MHILILVISVVFTLTAFLVAIPFTQNTHPILGFLFYQLQVILQYSLIFGLFAIIILISFSRIMQFEKTHSFHKKSLLTFFHLVTLLIIGIFISYLFLLSIAWIQLNSTSILVTSNPRALNIITQKKDIIAFLKDDNTPPNILATDDTSFAKLVSISQSQAGTDTFYGSTILPSIPSFLILPAKDLGPSFILDNTLVVANVNKNELETLSPLVGYMFIKQYFPQRKIKFYPKIIVINDKEYESYRVVDSKEKIKTLDKQLLAIDTAISSTSASLQKMEASIETNKKLIPQTYAQKDTQMKKCNAQGNYVGKVFKRTNTPQFCQEQASSFDTIVDTAHREITQTTTDIPVVENQLKVYNQYKTFFASQRTLNAVLDKNVPHELGVFKPPSTIRILIDTQSAHALADYFATTVHEYLHYASATDNKSFNILFFEEGITEYFTRQIIKNNLNTSTNMGYPIFAKIIQEMTKAIPESDLAEIYFTKDQAKLEKTLNTVYGETFYKDTALTFTTLQYASNPQQILSLANTIMERIGGAPMTSQDIFSTESQL